MSLSFEMRREHHAISEFSATLNFFQPVGPATFLAVKEEAKRQAETLDLPAPIRRQSLQFTIGNGSAVPAPIPLEGFGYQSFANTGEIDTALLCEPASVAYTTHRYSCWAEILPRLVATFGAVGVQYLKEVPSIRSFTVQYINEFRSRSPGLVGTKELFRPDNQWLAPAGVETEDLWHCHVGRYVPIASSSRFLVNVNFDVNLVQMPDLPVPVTVVRVLILVSLNYDIPGQSVLTIPASRLDAELRDHFERAHVLEKQILAEIFADDYLEAIGAQNEQQ